MRVPGVRMAYEVQEPEINDDKPLYPVVLLHANYVDSRLWDREAVQLSKSRRVVRYDMVGFGQSLSEEAESESSQFETPDEGISPEDLERYLDETLEDRAANEDLEDLLDHLGIDQAVLLGLDLGAEVVAGLAVENPDRVAALILVSPTLPDFLPFSEEWAEWVELRGEPWADKVGIMDDTLFEKMGETGDPKPMIDLFMSDAAFAPRDEASRLRLRTLMEENSVSFINPQARTGVPGGSSSDPVAKRLSGLEKPTLLIAGKKDEREVFETFERLSARMPFVQQRVLEGAGHFPNLDAPEQFLQEVLEFLRNFGDR